MIKMFPLQLNRPQTTPHDQESSQEQKRINGDYVEVKDDRVKLSMPLIVSREIWNRQKPLKNESVAENDPANRQGSDAVETVDWFSRIHFSDLEKFLPV